MHPEYEDLVTELENNSQKVRDQYGIKKKEVHESHA